MQDSLNFGVVDGVLVCATVSPICEHTSMAATTQSLHEVPRTIINLTYISAALSFLTYVCSGYNIERRPEYPYNIVLIPFLCTLVHHYFYCSAAQRDPHPKRPADFSALSTKNIVSTGALSVCWFVFVRIHVLMGRVSGKGGVVPTMALAKSFGTAESIVLAAITWEAVRTRFL